MRDNFNIIRPLLEFDPRISNENMRTFYFIQIIKRRKENPNMKVGQAILDNFYLYEEADLDRLKEKIVDRCNKHNARAYINLNKLDLERIALFTQKYIIDLIIQGQFKAVKNAYTIACGNHHSQDDKRWVVDIDEAEMKYLPDVRKKIEQLHSEITKNEYKIVAEIPTKTGMHIISNPFNMKAFSDVFGNMITVHKNSPTVLYIP